MQERLENEYKRLKICLQVYGIILYTAPQGVSLTKKVTLPIATFKSTTYSFTNIIMHGCSNLWAHPGYVPMATLGCFIGSTW
jgi:hypothetical protein